MQFSGMLPDLSVREFYVYVLEDPRDKAIFYVGKGTGDRLNAHVREAKSGKPIGNKAKLARIREIVQSGHKVIARKLKSYSSELDAFQHEKDLISSLPGLTNILAGGQGWAMSPDAYAVAQKARADRLQAKIDERYRQHFKRHLDLCDSFGDTWEWVLPCANGVSKANDLHSLLRNFVQTGQFQQVA